MTLPYMTYREGHTYGTKLTEMENYNVFILIKFITYLYSK